MDMLFLKILNMSIASSWVILAVMVMRQILKKAPRWVSCLLWGIAAVRLGCPFSVESVFSLLPSAEVLSPQTVQYARRPMIDSGIDIVNNALNPVISETFAPMPGASVNPLHVWIFTAGIVWLMGLVLMLAYAFVSYLRLGKQVRESVPFKDHIWMCDAVRSPFILGIFRPEIYLSSSTDGEQFDYMIAHEMAHLKRLDHIWKPLGYLLLAVHWFNPIVWIAYVLFCRDIEFACDEKVIKDLTLQEKKAYSHALLACSTQKSVRLSCPLAFGEVGVKERIKRVLSYKKPALWIGAAAVAVCIVMVTCFLTNPASSLKLQLSDAVWASVISGNSGEIISVTDDDLRILTAEFENMRFVKAGRSDESTGWSYRIVWYDQAGREMEDVIIMSDRRIQYGNYFYDISGDQTIDIAHLEKLKAESHHTFQAVILEINGEGMPMLIAPVEGSDELRSSDRFRVSMEHMPASPEPKVGDIIEIEYNGQIMEIYPALLGEIYSITVVSHGQEDHMSVPSDLTE